MTKESFISIGWRLIPYYLNNWVRGPHVLQPAGRRANKQHVLPPAQHSNPSHHWGLPCPGPFPSLEGGSAVHASIDRSGCHVQTVHALIGVGAMCKLRSHPFLHPCCHLHNAGRAAAGRGLRLNHPAVLPARVLTPGISLRALCLLAQEQQWGAECSSMIMELPHFALELLVVLPCAQVSRGPWLAQYAPFCGNVESCVSFHVFGAHVGPVVGVCFKRLHEQA